MVCAALYVLASKFGDILTRSTMKISPAKSKLIAISGGIVLCVLSYSLFMSLNLGVMYFLAGLFVLTFAYVAVFARNVKISNDLVVNYTEDAEDGQNV
ncbi:MAG: hypothetical protein IJG51_10640 [Synergistaceae bacterium]|nr:hypothetical protein [Synergistaceae bacterium]MBQ3399334.1 hypothetical protein [Synergistaceae bacterium]MBQ3759510.1 hypothetical protein [Synergistaceae bacterium]MBQ4402402.1 hypothetical protein [Synergistaceae bacterium]MBQ6666219.1 hypothetical protein [Synergistaceae bacterium]